MRFLTGRHGSESSPLTPESIYLCGQDVDKETFIFGASACPDRYPALVAFLVGREAEALVSERNGASRFAKVAPRRRCRPRRSTLCSRIVWWAPDGVAEASRSLRHRQRAARADTPPCRFRPKEDNRPPCPAIPSPEFAPCIERTLLGSRCNLAWSRLAVPVVLPSHVFAADKKDKRPIALLLPPMARERGWGPLACACAALLAENSAYVHVSFDYRWVPPPALPGRCSSHSSSSPR